MSSGAKEFTPSPEEKALLDHYYQISREVRGGFLEQAIWLDHVLSDLLAYYFCPENEKRPVFFSEVVNGMDFKFSTRIALLRTILEKLRPDLKEKYSDVCDKLDKIRRFRNRLAHSHVKADDADIANATGGAVTVCFYEDGERKEQVLSLDDVKLRLKEASAILMRLLELRSQLIPDYEERSRTGH